jgi:CheY-like chemotaxis protein
MMRSTSEILRLLLDGDGVEVLVAHNGQEALEMVREERPHLILSDVMMPVLDGRELCRRVRADPATSHIAVILMSAAHQKGAARYGADAFIRKPFDLLEVLEKVDLYLTPTG